MKSFLLLSLILIAGPLLANSGQKATEVVKRARATVATEQQLKDFVTLQLNGRIVPAEAGMPEAIVHITARKPSSQRLEVRVGEVVETTIIDCEKSCMIRSNLSDKSSHRMRMLSEPEEKRIRHSTRSLFAYFRPDYKRGEKLTYAGIEQRRGVRSHKLIYSNLDGTSTTRFFAVNDDTLVSVLTDQGVESVEIGSQVVGGIKFPEKIEYYQGKQKLHTFIVDKIKVNKPLREDSFIIPKKRKGQPAQTKPAGQS